MEEHANPCPRRGLSLDAINAIDTDRFDEVNSFTEVTDGNVIFCARRGAQWFLVVDEDERTDPFDGLMRLTSWNDSNPIFWGWRGDQHFIIWDGGQLGPFDYVDLPCLTTAPDGSPIVVARRDGSYIIAIGLEEIGPHEDVYDVHLECEAVAEQGEDGVYDMRVGDSTLVFVIAHGAQTLRKCWGFF